MPARAGLAVGVHATQFAIRGAGLYEAVLALAAETAGEWADRPVAMIAGLAGRTGQAVGEAKTAVGLGYHAGLLSLGALKEDSEDALVDHCRRVADEIPLVGFYLQPAVGGRPLSAGFWKRFARIDNAVAVKAAPFDRYRTIDVARGIADAGAEDRIALYTGNDDHIVLDLTAPIAVRRQGGEVRIRIRGGLLGHWSVWTGRAVALLARIRAASRTARWTTTCSRSIPASPTATARSSMRPTDSGAASPAATRSCGARACWRGSGASIRPRR